MAVADFVDHLVVWLTVNSLAETFRFAADDPEFGAAIGFSGTRASRFLHNAESIADLAKQSQMQRELGRRTECCFRCVGMDAVNGIGGRRVQHRLEAWHALPGALPGVHAPPPGDVLRALEDVEVPPEYDVVDGEIELTASLAERNAKFGAQEMVAPFEDVKVPQEYVFMDGEIEFTMSLAERNAKFGAQETVAAFGDVELPPEYVLMDGEIEFTMRLAERFTAYHRRSYICKAGLGDVVHGAVATVSDYNGASTALRAKHSTRESVYLCTS